MLKELIKSRMDILTNSEKTFSTLKEETFEQVCFDYFRMLILISLVASLFNIVWSFLQVSYLNMFRNVEVNYLRYLNFVLAQSSTIALLYMLSGTFLLFFLSLLLYLFFKIPYTELLKKMFYALTPLLLFGWSPLLAGVLVIWVIFLFVVGVKLHQPKQSDRLSIEQRT